MVNRNKEGKLEKLGMPEIIEVLTQYEIVLVEGKMFGQDKTTRGFGYCDYTKRRIYVDEDRNYSTIIRTIMHEISHAYHYMNCLNDSENNTRRVERNTWEEYKRRTK